MTESDTAGMWMCMHAACVARRPSVATPVPRMQDVARNLNVIGLNVLSFQILQVKDTLVTWLSWCIINCFRKFRQIPTS